MKYIDLYDNTIYPTEERWKKVEEEWSSHLIFLLFVTSFLFRKNAKKAYFRFFLFNED